MGYDDNDLLVKLSSIFADNLPSTVRQQKTFKRYKIVQKSEINLFYMTHTFYSEVSLHSWLLWPMVQRAASA